MNKSDKNIKLIEFIDRNRRLFWYIPDDAMHDISDELILENTLNYAGLDSIVEYFNIIGLSRAAGIFKSLHGRKKHNISPEIYNFFSLVFKRYVPGYSK